MLVFQQASEPSVQFVERELVSSATIASKLAKYHRVAISGLPGVGKTELISHFVKKAREFEKSYKGIFWLNSDSELSIQSGLNEIARQMNLINEEETKIDEVRQLVRNQLNKQDHWLIVFDNLDDVKLIDHLLPERRGTRHVVITTRYREAHMALGAASIHLEALSKIEASQLF